MTFWRDAFALSLGYTPCNGYGVFVAFKKNTKALIGDNTHKIVFWWYPKMRLLPILEIAK